MPSDFDRKSAETIRPHMAKVLAEQKKKMANKMIPRLVNPKNVGKERAHWNRLEYNFHKK